MCAAAGADPVLRIGLLGGFTVWLSEAGGEQRCDGPWRLRKAKSLVKVLALARGHVAHRDQLAEALWPGKPAGAAANNLHQALHAARRALGAPSALVLHDEVVRLGSAHEVVTDVDLFEVAAREAEAGARPEDYRRALDLYGGDLLPEDQYEDWAAPRRAELLEQRRTVLVGLARLLQQEGRTEEAARLLQDALSTQPLDEPASRLLMQVHAGSGRRSEALQEYARLRTELQEVTGADPDPRTTRLHRALLDGSVVVPPTGAARSTAHNLPRSATGFVGRDRTLADTEALLDRTRLLTLTGPGGCGKTRLALELAWRRAGRARHGVWLVELGGLRDPDLVPQAVASVLGIVLPAGRPATAALAAAVGTRPLLLVLDTCEHLVEACAGLAAELLRRCPDVALLATSREPLRVAGEVCWRTPSLTTPGASTPMTASALARYEAVQLFTVRSAAARPGFVLDAGSAPAVARICAGLDGIPLALELAAARVAHLSVDQIATRLDDALALLGGGDRSALTRQQTLAGTLRWSHELLTEPERVLLRRLAVFAGGPELEAVEAVCADGRSPEVLQEPVVSVLSRLVDKSLVLAEPVGGSVRYRLLDTVRQFAGHQLDEAGETDAVQRRHLAWFSDLAASLDLEHGGPVVTSPSRRLDLAHDDLRAALRTGVERDGPAALRLAVSLWRFWLARGHFGEGARWLDESLAASPGRTPLHAAAWFAHAALDVRRGDGSRLAQYGRDGVQVARDSADSAELAQALHLHALLSWLRGAWDEAASLSDEAAVLAGRSGLLPLLACATHVRALVLLSRADVAGARSCLLESLRLVERLVDEPHPFFSTATLGFSVEQEQSQMPIVCFEESVLLARKVGAEQAAGYLLVGLATAARLDGDTDEASRLLQDADLRFDALGDAEGRALALNLHGALDRARGRPVDARTRLLESIRLRRTVGDRRGVALSRGNLGLLLVSCGQSARGGALLRRAALSFDAMHDGPGVAGTVLNRGAAAVLVGDDREAQQLLRTARGLLNVPGAHRARAWTALALAGASRGVQADVLREEAAGEFARLGERRGLARSTR